MGWCVEGCDDIIMGSGVVGDEIGEGVLSGEVGGPRGVRSKGSITRKGAGRGDRYSDEEDILTQLRGLFCLRISSTNS